MATATTISGRDRQQQVDRQAREAVLRDIDDHLFDFIQSIENDGREYAAALLAYATGESRRSPVRPNGMNPDIAKAIRSAVHDQACFAKIGAGARVR